jgi:hypothetical protein
MKSEIHLITFNWTPDSCRMTEQNRIIQKDNFYTYGYKRLNYSYRWMKDRKQSI